MTTSRAYHPSVQLRGLTLRYDLLEIWRWELDDHDKVGANAQRKGPDHDTEKH